MTGFIIGMLISGLIWFLISYFIGYGLKYSKIKISSFFFVNTIYGIIWSTIPFLVEINISIPIVWKVFGGLIICGCFQLFSAIIYEETEKKDNEIISINQLLMIYIILGTLCLIIGLIGIGIVAWLF